MRVRGLVPAAAAVTLAVALTGCGSPATATTAAKAAPNAPATHVKNPAADQFKSVRTYATVALPSRLRIPAIDLVTPALQELGRASDKSIALPTRPELAGWFKGGPRPGQPGPAVIIGHVDWDHSGAVFFRLREMKPGESVFVDRADGSTAEFTVTQVRQVSKSDFPTADVYAPDLDSSLRLITCGGQFDYSTHNYLDNVIVFASPV
ncbi:MAG TPA: class F sortase [Mycobacteriales bacterium]|jgi:LPXTG-site transpeptidase (sortase) family protein|nr:class F sortase [Mycobacteriales bacterium]